jgi:predicted 2-oxoglutarate/Fe(II)-dependent dioxygenase YbiX
LKNPPPDLDFFRRLGLLIVEDFLDDASCAVLRAEAGRSEASNLESDYPNSTACRAKVLKLRETTRSSLKKRLSAIKPAIESHFKLTLADPEAPQLLRYNKGDFFKPHTDSLGGAAGAPSRRRRVSLIVFANSQADKPARERHVGGSLVLYGLIDGPQWRRCGFPLAGRAGLLVAFPSHLAHEVKPVEHGVRDTVISFMAPR